MLCGTWGSHTALGFQFPDTMWGYWGDSALFSGSLWGQELLLQPLCPSREVSWTSRLCLASLALVSRICLSQSAGRGLGQSQSPLVSSTGRAGHSQASLTLG